MAKWCARKTYPLVAARTSLDNDSSTNSFCSRNSISFSLFFCPSWLCRCVSPKCKCALSEDFLLLQEREREREKGKECFGWVGFNTLNTKISFGKTSQQNKTHHKEEEEREKCPRTTLDDDACSYPWTSLQARKRCARGRAKIFSDLQLS